MFVLCCPLQVLICTEESDRARGLEQARKNIINEVHHTSPPSLFFDGQYEFIGMVVSK
jgi:hypothetical protein